MMKKIKGLNYPLIIGALIVLGLLVISVYGEQIVKLDPYAINVNTIISRGGETFQVVPQSPPNEVNIWGTDVLGRDIFSRIMTGARTTFTLALLISLFRFLIAIPFSLFSGFGEKISSKVIDFFSRVFSAIPALIFSIIILKMKSIKELELRESIIAFIIVLTFVGWGRLSKILKERVKDILKQNFIQGEIAIGKNKFLIAIQNVLPHLTAFIIIQFFLEMGRSLMLIAQLGIFQIYIGSNKLAAHVVFAPPPEGFGLDFMPSYEPEWGSMLASSKFAIIAGKPWLILYSACAFCISVLGLNLLGEGLKAEINKRTSMVITNIKKIPFHLSPKTYVYEFRNFKNNKKSLLIKTGVVVIILIFILMPPVRSLIEIDSQEVYAHVQEFTKEKYQGRRTGSEERDEALGYIVERLKEYNLQPYFEEGYIQEAESGHDIIELVKSELKLIDENNNLIDIFKLNDNFVISKNLFDKYCSEKDGQQIEEYINDYELSLAIVTENQYNKELVAPESQYIYKTITGSQNQEEFRVYRTKPNNDENAKPDYIYPCFVILDKDSPISEKYISNLTVNKNVFGVIVEADNLDNIEEFQKYNSGPEDIESYLTYKSRKIGTPFIITVDSQVADKIRNNKGSRLTIHNRLTINESVKFRNIAGVIKGNGTIQENKIVIATNYDYLGMDNKGLLYNGTSISVALEIAKNLVILNKEHNQDIVFMFFDGSKFKDYMVNASINKKGSMTFAANNIKETKRFFTIALNNLGINDSNRIYLDTSRLSTQRPENYEYVKYFKKRAAELGIKLEHYNLVEGTEDIVALCKFGGEGIMLESINNKEQFQYDKSPQNDVTQIDSGKLKKLAQVILDTIIHIAYND